MRTLNTFSWELISALAALELLLSARFSLGQSRGNPSSTQMPHSVNALAVQAPSPSNSRSVGSTFCRLIRIQCDTANSDDGPDGELVAKPMGTNTKVLKLIIRDEEKPCVQLAGHKFSARDAEELVRAGLFCTVLWKYEQGQSDRKSATKELVSIQLVPFEVRGTIIEIDDEHVTIRARPTKNRDWPNRPARDQALSEGRGFARPLALKLKLGVIDDITKCRDSKNHPLQLSDFEEGEEVEASAVLGQKEGILATLRALKVSK